MSTLLVGGAWWLFEWEQANGATIAEARTAALNLFVAVEAFYLFNCRSLTRSMWQVGLFTNRWILGRRDASKPSDNLPSPTSRR